MEGQKGSSSHRKTSITQVSEARWKTGSWRPREIVALMFEEVMEMLGEAGVRVCCGQEGSRGVRGWRTKLERLVFRHQGKLSMDG